MKKLPIGIQTFEEIRRGGYAYADKTDFVRRLTEKGKYFFLARPRRFGKSLLISTLKAYFLGRKELFTGLKLEETEQDWTISPIIHLDFAGISYQEGKTGFKASLLIFLQETGAEYGIELKHKILVNAFRELVIALHDKHGKPVILIDEYDKAMVNVMTDEQKFVENREVLSELYGTIKSLDAYLRFVMLTGVSRFSKVGIFSGLNNLEDITLQSEFADICGFSQTELTDNFSENLKVLENKFEFTSEENINLIKFWYNGFSFDGFTKLYNPFSILNLFSSVDFGNFWFSSGTPTFLIDLIKKQKALPENFENMRVADLLGSTESLEDFPLIPLLFQTGYLTISRTERQGVEKFYYLDYPNEEVRRSFIMHVLAAFLHKQQFKVTPEALRLKEALYDENTDRFLLILRSFLADIPARLHIPKEAYCHSLVYMLLRLVGVKLLLEKETDKGRIDAVLELPDKVYIIEFKFAQNKRVKNVKTLAGQAMRQIEARKYHESYVGAGKKIILFGIGFLEGKVAGEVKAIQT